MDGGGQQSLFDLIRGEKSDHPVQADPVAQLEELKNSCLACNRCALRSSCGQVVFGDGNPRARLMLVGEGPGAEEDRLGIPFVGTAGRLLERILEAVNLKRDELYIANVVKCRPPANRLPTAPEVEKCLPHLSRQIELINPAVIVCLGALATRMLIGSGASITQLRGRWHQIAGRRYMPTFHPAALLRDNSKKRPVWEDFKEVDRYYRQITDGGSGS